MRRFLATVLFLATLASPVVAAAERDEFFFYSPEVGSGNLSLLKQAAEKFFADAGLDVGFQPFARLEDLESRFAERRPAYLLAPRWALTRDCLGAELTPVARPVRDGRMFDRRALLAGRTIATVEQLAGGSIATTVPAIEAERGSIGLTRFRGDHPDVRIIPVPKDVDALLALGFGQVDAAFVSMAQLEMLSRVNPSLTGSLHEIGYSDHTPFPLIYATDSADAEMSARLADALAGAVGSVRGRRLATLLGYDQWMSIDADEAGTDTPTACRTNGEAAR